MPEMDADLRLLIVLSTQLDFFKRRYQAPMTRRAGIKDNLYRLAVNKL